MTTRNYSSRSQQTTLTSAVTAGASTIVVQSGTALLGGQSIPAGTTFTIVVDPDTALEEILDATAVSTNTFSVTRAIDGSSAQAHSAGAVVRHMAIGRDYREANTHIEASTGVHGISNASSVVGTTDTQTLTNKTLTSPTITNPSISGAGVDASIVFEGATADAYETTLTVVDPTQDNTITLPNTTGTVVIATATQTLTNKTLTSPIISGSPVITGLSSAGMLASSATPKDYVDSILGSATAAATSAASAAASATAAATSATSAAASALAAASSATASASSATAAATSATSAAASATAAATSATSTAASATTAANSVATIAGYATSAANSATAAATSATSAASSATASANSATASASSASASATSATASASSASAAATSASSALTSATSAATSAASAATSAASAAAAVAASFTAKGQLLAGTGTSTFSPLTVATTNGYVLTSNSATATGLEWTAANPGDITAVTAGTGLTGGGTSGAVSLAVDTGVIQARVANVSDTEIGYLDGVTSAIQTQLDSKLASATAATTYVPNSLADAKGDLIAATANDTPARLAVGNNGETLVADSSTSTGLRYTSNFAAGKNTVINGAFQVWQRGTSIAVGAAQPYTADRWVAWRNALATGLTISRQTSDNDGSQYVCRVQRDLGNTSTQTIFFGYANETANVEPLQGQFVTVSFYARKGANFSDTTNSFLTAILLTGTSADTSITGLGTSVGSLNAVLTTSWQRFSFTTSASIASTVLSMGVRFSYVPSGTAGAADFAEIDKVQIEPGSVATAFQTATGTIQGELAACQRYYYRLGTGNGQPLGLCQGETTNIPLAVAVLPVTMRTAPTLDQATGTNFYLVRTANANNNFNSFILESSSTTAAVFYSTGTIVSGAGGRFTTNNASSYVGFSAEL